MRFPVLWVCLFLGSIHAEELKPASTLPELQQRLAECVSQPKYAGAQWGVKVVSLDTGRTVFDFNSRKLLSPASNTKLYTVALALDRLGPDYRIKTSAFASARPRPDGTLDGDLIIYGRGDPTINARLHSNDVFQTLEPLAAALSRCGVTRISGDLVGDSSFFRGPEFGSGWVWEDTQYGYGAEISALTIDDNVVQGIVEPGARVGEPCRIRLVPPTSGLMLSNRTQTAVAGTQREIKFYRPPSENVLYVSGKLAVGTTNFTDQVPAHDPSRLFVSWLKESLERHGIILRGRLRTLNWLDRQASPIDTGRWVELTTLESLPVREISREIQKTSRNLYSDLLLAHIGEISREASDPAEMTSEELGVRELKKFLAGAGVSPEEFFFEEGSGLSRDNLTTADATVTLLQHMSRHKQFTPFIDALPIAGVDGTLSNRMKATPAAANARAKTGSLRWANSLSGYVTTAAGEHLAFSLMLNRQHPAEASTARADLDLITARLAGFTGRSSD
jgi:D-alanyl-D-alanine carboxypeptidase/D-alanyl-D-alanine-endopeptidase (penicillin-binding protein 4)